MLNACFSSIVSGVQREVRGGFDGPGIQPGGIQRPSLKKSVGK